MIPDFPHNIRIRLAWLKFFLLRPDFAKSLPCWLSQFSFSKLRQPTGQRQSNVRKQQKKIMGQSYSYIMRKVWYHKIWIQNYFGFIVSDLMYIHSTYSGLHIRQLIISYTATLFIIFFSQDQLVIMQIFEINWETKWCRLQMPILKRG